MMNSFEIILENNLSELDKLNTFVEGIGEQIDLPAGLLMKLNLVLEEIFTNIVNYAYDDDANHQVLIQVSQDQDMLKIRIEDDGKKFDFSAFPDPDTDLTAEERSIGGLGIHFVRKLMDDVDYQYYGDKNVLILKKKIKG
ncbi:MAG: ATP-binding protein [Bacteroidota bacterium]|nr:ATP-binding protein [Bacteroidota bacterium]